MQWQTCTSSGLCCGSCQSALASAMAAEWQLSVSTGAGVRQPWPVPCSCVSAWPVQWQLCVSPGLWSSSCVWALPRAIISAPQTLFRQLYSWIIGSDQQLHDLSLRREFTPRSMSCYLPEVVTIQINEASIKILQVLGLLHVWQIFSSLSETTKYSGESCPWLGCKIVIILYEIKCKLWQFYIQSLGSCLLLQLF